MAVQIQFRRGTSVEWSTVNPTLAQGEMGIETDTSLFKIGNGIDTWNDLDYGGLRGYVGSEGYRGSEGTSLMQVPNVLYVSMSGNDENDGKNLGTSKRTIKAAVQAATTGTTIFVKSGDYIEMNPILVPHDVSIIGDNLRSVTVRPKNITQDLFWVNNGVYLAHMTFKDHEAPAAAVAFPTDGTAGAIYLSPYVQNCTSMTTTGSGMRVDGDHAEGTRSMVVDAFTQYNQGGIGIHMLNRGYTQLVSVFTICCDKAILCESGGSCSITNSNISFGNYGLYSDGVSDLLYTGKVKTATTVNSRTFTLNNLIQRPKIGDAVKFANDTTGTYYTVQSSTEFTPGGTTITTAYIQGENAVFRNARQTILDSKNKIRVDTIDWINETFLNFYYDQTKCSRDLGLIVDAVAQDLMSQGETQTTFAGIQYWNHGSYVGTIAQELTTTTNAINYLNSLAQKIIINNVTGPRYQSTLTQFTASPSASGSEQIILNREFTTITNILLNGVSGVTDLIIPNGLTASSNTNIVRAYNLLQSNKAYMQAEVIAYVNQTRTPGFVFDSNKCHRDVGFILDSVSFDLLYGGNLQAIQSGVYYYGYNSSSSAITGEVEQTINAYNYLKTLVKEVITGTRIISLYQTSIQQVTTTTAGTTAQVTSALSLIDNITDIIKNGPSVANTATSISLTRSTNPSVVNAANLLNANRNFLRAEIIAYINKTFKFDYNQQKCSRDLGYILDAVADDMVLNTNYKSVYAGTAYYRAVSSLVTTSQKPQTISAINYAKDKLLGIIDPLYGSSSTVHNRIVDKFGIVTSILDLGLGVAPAYQFNEPSNVDQDRSRAKNLIISNRQFMIEQGSAFISTNYPALVFNTLTCRRDIGYIIDAVTYDLLYQGNAETANAADEYYGAGQLQIAQGEVTATVATFAYLGYIAGQIVTNTNVTVNQNIAVQSTILPAASTQTSGLVNGLFNIVTELLSNGYTSVLTLEESHPAVAAGSNVEFFEFSLISSSGHTFEWVGSGININNALPSLGGIPIVDNQVVTLNGGQVYYTSTDERGDFRIGDDFTINRKTGTITGRTFSRSLFAIMTPYILSVTL